jgi:starch phosphorylase
VEEVQELRSRGYHPLQYYESNPELKEAIDLIGSGHFSKGDVNLFKPLVDSLLGHDEYLLLADYQPYVDCQEEVSKTYRDEESWARMSILNVARMGKFSSDRSIREYSEKIWKVKPIPVRLDKGAGCE